MKTRFWMLVLVVAVLFVLVGCSSRSDDTVKSQENNSVVMDVEAIEEEKVETINVEIYKKKEVTQTQREEEFNKAREELIEDGIIDHDTPTYMIGDVVPLTNLDREYSLFAALLGEKDERLTIHIDITGEERLRLINARIIFGDKNYKIRDLSFGRDGKGYIRHNFEGVIISEVEHLKYLVVTFSVNENNDAFIVLQRDIEIVSFR